MNLTFDERMARKKAARTGANLRRKRTAEKAKRELQAHLDSLMGAASKEAPDDLLSEDQLDRLGATGVIRGSMIGPAFVADKRR